MISSHHHDLRRLMTFAAIGVQQIDAIRTPVGCNPPMLFSSHGSRGHTPSHDIGSVYARPML